MANAAFTRPQIQAVNRLVERSRKKIKSDYSTGWPHFSGGRTKLGMHGQLHTDHVIRDSGIIAENMPGQDTQSKLEVKLSAGVHDVVQLLGDGKNEAASVTWFIEELKRDNAFDLEARKYLETIVGPSLEATRVVRVGYTPKKQFFWDLDYPSQKAEDNALCVCAGDFGDFFTRFGPLVSVYFYGELQKVSPHEAPPMNNYTRFSAGQVDIALNWKFPGNKRISSKKVEKLLASERKKVTKFYLETHELWTSGRLETWEQLKKRALDFMEHRIHA